MAPGFEQPVLPGVSPGWQVGASAPPAPWLAVELDLGVPPDGPVAAGLVHPGGHVAVTYDPTDGRVALEIAPGGDQAAHVLRRRRSRAPRRLAFVLCGRRVSALVDTGRGWRVLLTAPPEALTRWVDPHDPDQLGAYRLGWRGRATGRSGTFGLVGIRDPHLVQHRDGRPYERDGHLLLTATCAGVGGFREAHWGVFTLDPSTYALTQVAHLFSARDGLVLGDHAGQVVVDEESGRCDVLVSSWGDFDATRGVHARHATTGLGVLDGISVVPTHPLPLPTPHSTWDPAAVVVDGRWQVAYVQSPSQEPFDFRPALAAGPDLRSLAAVGADTSRRQCEGPVLARVDGAWRLLASDGDARRFPAYDLAMRRVGRLDAPYGTNLPHSQLAPAPDGATLLVTFDGGPWPPRQLRTSRTLPYGTHGDLVVLRAEPGAALLIPESPSPESPSPESPSPRAGWPGQPIT